MAGSPVNSPRIGRTLHNLGERRVFTPASWRSVFTVYIKEGNLLYTGIKPTPKQNNLDAVAPPGRRLIGKGLVNQERPLVTPGAISPLSLRDKIIKSRV